MVHNQIISELPETVALADQTSEIPPHAVFEDQPRLANGGYADNLTFEIGAKTDGSIGVDALRKYVEDMLGEHIG